MKKLTAFLITTVLMVNSGLAAGGPVIEADIASGIGSVAPADVKDAPKESVSINENMEITATTKHEEDAQLPYAIDVRYPQIAGENLSAAAQNFNSLVSDMVNKSMQQFKNYVKADMPHMQTLPDSVKHNNLHVDYDIDVVKPANQILISLRLSIEGIQAGRAHPYHTHQVLNYDLNKGKILALKDLFKPRANYLSMFAKFASKDLGEKLQDKWMINEGTAPLAKNYQQWNLEDDGILVTFEEYQVAPYTYGSQEVKIPYNILKSLLAPTAPILSCAENAKGCSAE